MNILLINTNPVVSRLISLCMRDENSIFEEVNSVSSVARDRYDIVFVDEASYRDEAREFLENLIIRKKVFLTSEDAYDDEKRFFDKSIKKPFLPSQIIEVLEGMEEDEVLDVTAEMSSVFPLSGSEEEKLQVSEVPSEENVETEDTVDSEVLESNEKEKIKQLLLEMEEDIEESSDEDYKVHNIEVVKQQLIEDGLEIVDEEELSQKRVDEALNADKTERKEKKKKKRPKKSEKNKDEPVAFEEVLLAAVSGMKVKKIKKLLKGAEVSINIRFKDDD